MNCGWKIKKLGEICEIQLGKTPARANSSFWDREKETGNIWLSIADLLNVDGHRAIDSKEYLSNEGAKLCKRVKKGTLLVSFKLTLGRLAYAGRDLFTNEAIAALTINDECELSREYLFYFLQFFDWEKEARDDVKLKGMTLNKAKLKNIGVSIPSMAEQKRIVAILDEAFAGIDTAIANTEKSLANVRELFHSYIHSWFNVRPAAWPQRNLEALTDVQSGGTPLKSKKEYWGGKVPWYSSGELNRLHTVEPKDCITALGVKESNAKVFPPGSLLVGMYDTAAMKMSILDREAAFNQAIAGLRPTENLDLRFVMFALNAMKPAILGLRRGVRQKNLSLRKIKDIQIPVPALKEQTHVAEQILGFKQEISHLELIHQRKMNALVELKQSLLQKAFSGELTADRAEQEVESATA